MCGDKAPGPLQAAGMPRRCSAPKTVVFLVGDETVIRSALESGNLPPNQRERYRVVPTTEVVGMD